MRFVRTTISHLLAALLVAAAIAQSVRDRALWLALLMYIPLAPIALVAAAWELALRGRALPKRGLLLVLAVASGLFSLTLSWSPARAPEGETSGESLTIVHWNTQWGGRHGQRTTRAMFQKLSARDPDLVCLSEAPPYSDVQSEWKARRREPYHYATSANGPHNRYQYRMTVISREPATLRKEWELRIGHAALFEIERGRTLRVLIVDLQSSPLLPRSPSLRQVAAIVDEAFRFGRPIDIVAGDFNTPGRFLGFDSLSAAGEGYERTALWSGQWRATWPTTLLPPLFDIDHVWVHSPLSVVRSEFFAHPATDHRGQLAVIRHPRRARSAPNTP